MAQMDTALQAISHIDRTQQEGRSPANHTMIYFMGNKAHDIVKSFTFTEGDEKKYTKVKEKFDQHFIIKRNVILERAKCNMRKQEPS